MNKNKNYHWYSTKVLKVTPSLSYGFREGDTVYTQKSGEKVLVFNGRYATRTLSKAEARKCLKLIKRLDSRENDEVDRRYSCALYHY